MSVQRSPKAVVFWDVKVADATLEAFMSINRIEKSQWKSYFDRMSSALAGKRLEIDIVSPAIGDQEAHQVPVSGVTYDPKDDVLAVIGEGIDHSISHPDQINVDERMDQVHSLEVIDNAGGHHILKLKDPLELRGSH
jgi:hypothetical protein